MNLIRFKPYVQWLNPLGEIENIRNQIDQLFDFTLGRSGERDPGLLSGTWAPAVDIYETDDDFVVYADVPGVAKDNVSVEATDNILTIKGERTASGGDKRSEIRSERFIGSFTRTIALPSEVDAAQAKASLDTGVLKLTLPKKAEAKTRAIKVNVQ
jgi:HSP20 family protein